MFMYVVIVEDNTMVLSSFQVSEHNAIKVLCWEWFLVHKHMLTSYMCVTRVCVCVSRVSFFFFQCCSVCFYGHGMQVNINLY